MIKIIDIFKKNILFCDYFKEWIELYKKGSVRDVTYKKYLLTLKWIETLAPDLRLKQIDRATYQQLINDYSATHEQPTVKDFNTQLKSCIKDAIDEGYIKKDPTRKVVIPAGKVPTEKKNKYLSIKELNKLIADLDLDLEKGISYDWLIYFLAKTGLRFSEAIAITPSDFNFKSSTLNVNKTWDYKGNGGFTFTKNKSSIRTIAIDKNLNRDFKVLCKNLPADKPIFIKEENGKIFNSTVNGVLGRHCKKVKIPVIAVHALRHTHASILLYSGVSLLSVSKRLGHANTTTTQKVYLHIILEMEHKDKNKTLKCLEEF